MSHPIPHFSPLFQVLSHRLILLLPLLAFGCTLPNFPGPQLQEAPPGFYREPEAGQERRMFPERQQLHYDVWVNAAWGDVTTIHINGHPGRIMRADVRDALEAAKLAAEEPVTFGEVQEQTIDGRAAWGWTERMHTDELGLVWIGYRVAIPYDTITYTIELKSGDPALKRNPDTLLAIAGTFAVGEVTWNVPLIVAVLAVLVVLIRILQKKRQERTRRLQGITLKKVETKEGPEGSAASAQWKGMPPKPPGTGGPPSRPGPPGGESTS